MVKVKQAGYSYIEVIIAAATLLILAHAFFTLITAAYQLLAISRIQVSARALATEQIELIRNLPYAEVGTQGGIPAGSIPQVQTQQLNGQDFTVTTSIIYIDDPFDNTAPTDTLPSDYKRARVTVTWNGTFPTQEIITLLTDVAPKGVESTAGGGTLQIQVFDSAGHPVPQADVTINAPTTSPPVNLTLFTDNYGTLTLPGAPTCTSCYNITVTKTDYSTDKTYTSAEVANPTQPEATVLENQLTPVSFAIDHISPTTITSQDSTLTTIGNVPFTLTSSKTIGTDTLGNPIYKFNEPFTTNSAGNYTLDLEWGSYTITLDNATYDLAGTNPAHPITITANTTPSITFIAIPHTTYSALLNIQNPSGQSIPSATVRLFNTTLGFDSSITTGTDTQANFGQAFFNNLTNNTYDIEITHPTYQTLTTDIDIDQNNEQTILLNEL